MKRIWFKIKEMWWKIVLAFVVTAGVLIFFYRLLKPAENKNKYVEAIATEARIALTESQLRGRLEKDKIGAIKKVFQNRLADTKRIKDRDERLNALIRLYEELDI